jgi:hypothetical protein
VETVFILTASNSSGRSQVYTPSLAVVQELHQVTDGLQREGRWFAIRPEGSILRLGDVPWNGILQRLLRLREF